MSRTIVIVILLSLMTFSTAGYAPRQSVQITEIAISVNEQDSTLRYQFTLLNTTQARLGSYTDYPGHQPLHINYAVAPNKSLAAHMQMERNTKYKKMALVQYQNSGNLEPNILSTATLEYAILTEADRHNVIHDAWDATLLVINGTRVISKIPLLKYRQPMSGAGGL